MIRRYIPAIAVASGLACVTAILALEPPAETRDANQLADQDAPRNPVRTSGNSDEIFVP